MEEGQVSAIEGRAGKGGQYSGSLQQPFPPDMAKACLCKARATMDA